MSYPHHTQQRPDPFTSDGTATDSVIRVRLRQVERCAALHAGADRCGVAGCRGTADRLCSDPERVPDR